MAGGGGLSLADDLLDLLADGFERDVQRLEGLGGDTLAFVDRSEQDVLGPDVVVVEHPRFFLREDHHPPRSVGESAQTSPYILQAATRRPTSGILDPVLPRGAEAPLLTGRSASLDAVCTQGPR